MSDNSTHPIWIVIPAFNEASTISRVVQDVSELHHNVIVVDDGSEDETGAVAAAEGAVVVRHILNRGQGASLRTGIAFALEKKAEIIVTFDADEQHDVTAIPDLVAPIQQNVADVVLGSRFLSHGREVPFTRRLLLQVATLFTRAVSRIAVTDTHNGLRALSREAAASIRITQDRMAHASEILDEISRLGLRWTEIPVRIRYSEYSRGKGQRSTGVAKVLLEYLTGRWIR